MPLQQPRPRGGLEQHGRRPFRGAVQRLLLILKSLSAQVGRFAGSSWTLARRSNCLLVAAHRRGGWCPLCQISSGCLTVARRQTTAGPYFRRLGNARAQGRADSGRDSTRRARRTDRARGRLATGLQPGQPSRCLYATIPRAQKQLPLARLRLTDTIEFSMRRLFWSYPVSFIPASVSPIGARFFSSSFRSSTLPAALMHS
jgi:hypothetical protein